MPKLLLLSNSLDTFQL